MCTVVLLANVLTEGLVDENDRVGLFAGFVGLGLTAVGFPEVGFGFVPGLDVGFDIGFEYAVVWNADTGLWVPVWKIVETVVE